MNRQTLLASFIASCMLAMAAHSAGPTVVQASTTAQIISAIRAANLRSGQTVIELAPKQYRFTQALQNQYGRSALPLIKGNIVIRGKSAQTTILDRASFYSGTGEPIGRFFAVAPGAHLTVSGVTLTHGSFGCFSETECPASEALLKGGSAIANFGGALTMIDCVVTYSSSGDYNGMQGGALYSEAGPLVIARCLIEDNSVTGNGGALALNGGTAQIQASIFRGNEAIPAGEGDGAWVTGGAIVVFSGQMTIASSTLSANLAGIFDDEPRGFGGAVWNAGSLTIRNSAVIENSALYVGRGGGIYNAGTASLRNTTVGGNSAGTMGGGIYNEGVLKLVGTSVASNFVEGYQPISSGECNEQPCPAGGGGLWNAATGTWNSTGGAAELGSSVIANNAGTSSGFGPDCEGVFASKGYNAVGDSAGCDLHRSATDRADLNARLGPLNESGVAGKAHFPVLQGSPLIDGAGPYPGGCTERDQIGRPRRDGNANGVVRCDIGSIEF